MRVEIRQSILCAEKDFDLWANSFAVAKPHSTSTLGAVRLRLDKTNGRARTIGKEHSDVEPKLRYQGVADSGLIQMKSHELCERGFESLLRVDVRWLCNGLCFVHVGRSAGLLNTSALSREPSADCVS